MHIIKRLTAMVLTTMLIISMFSGVYAAGETRWYGQGALSTGQTYTVLSAVSVKSDLTVPAGTVLYIKSGGNLLIHKGVNVNVYGEIRIASDGILTNSGKINVRSGGTLRVYGTALSTVSAALSVSGGLMIHPGAVAKMSSENLIYRSGSVVNSGRLYLLSSSRTTLSGNTTVTKSGNIYIDGQMSVTLSGSLRSAGYLSVGQDGALTVSGRAELLSGSAYTRFGTVRVTSGGKLYDSSAELSDRDASMAILTDEPEVLRRGIDVSYAQGEINWGKVASSGIDFAMLRAARGDYDGNGTKADICFYENIKGALASGLDVGVYFYSYALTPAQARKEAEYLVGILDGYKLTYPVVLDMEEEMGTVANATAIAEAFFSVIIDAGYYPMLYSYQAWMENYLDRRILDKYALWLADLSSSPNYTGGYYIWQYSFTGKVNGISGDVDLDYSFRDFPAILKKHGWNNL